MNIAARTIGLFVDRIAATEPGSDAARAIYAEVRAAGLGNEVTAEMRSRMAAFDAEARALLREGLERDRNLRVVK